MKRTKSFRNSLIKALKDPVEASEYLNAVLKEGDVNLLLAALRDVAEAQGGISKLSRQTKMNRANLYQMLSQHGNPRIHSVESVLKVFGLRIGVLPVQTPHGHHHRAA